SLSAPSPLGLPVYSASGFDLLSILARVATRPYPSVVLGPVDLTCSFVVVDVCRFDHPVVYCSPSFCALTGYSESEVLGRNCRFLQAPGGEVNKGDVRKFTSGDAVAHLRKSLLADKECQTSIVNYKKDGSAFINLVTVIPIHGGVSGAPHEEHDVVYQVGFQVDLSEQPNAILEKLRDGSYIVNYSAGSGVPSFGGMQQQERRVLQQGSSTATTGGRERKSAAIPTVVISKELKRILADPAFLRSIPITTSTTVPSPTSAAAAAAATAGNAVDDPVGAGANHLLHLLLLEALPDFVHVVSLKGSFLYVAPSVRRVLGYEPDEMVGGSIADYAHPEDVVPLMRELKESSATGLGSACTSTNNQNASQTEVVVPGMPRSVDLLFRARTKMGRYVWVECRGRLHVEPGKGRKAIVLSGRAREMMSLKWEDVGRAGGLARSIRVPISPTDEIAEQEVWGMMGGFKRNTATFISVGKGARDVLGYAPEELLGRAVRDVVVDAAAMDVVGGVVEGLRADQEAAKLRGWGKGEGRVRSVRCGMRRKDGVVVDVWFIIYRADADPDEAGAVPCMSSSGSSASTTTSTAGDAVKESGADMFDELAISRGSSWQYELQQLRFANMRLREEVAALEA
ncbi:hypothetical protein B0H34DRAFT_624907, partial [Crassisporium funariophilum]